jgi:putative ABC transport system permease protein
MTLRRRALDGLDDDIRDHLERETQDHIDRGMTPEAARDAALRAFGNVTHATEDTRAVWMPAIRTLLAGADRTQPIFDVKPLETALADSIAPRRFNLILLGTFAASALLLALIGIYGVIAYAVAQRTHEIGVRVALGAQRHEVVGMVLRQAMATAAIGIALGVAGALALTRVLATLLYDVTPTDPATFAGVTILLAVTALVACAGPALTAARVDPIVALRCE